MAVRQLQQVWKSLGRSMVGAGLVGIAWGFGGIPLAWSDEAEILAVAIGNPQTAQEVVVFQQTAIVRNKSDQLNSAAAPEPRSNVALLEEAPGSIVITKQARDDLLAEKFFSTKLRALLMNDFNFYRKTFQVYAAEDAPKNDDAPTAYQVKLQVIWPSPPRPYLLKVQVVQGNKEIVSFSEEFPAAALHAYRAIDLGHQVADRLYQGITGKKSIFTSKIIFVSDRDSVGKKQIKEIYQANFDGGNVRRLTFHRGVVIGPDISYDGKKIIYSLIDGNAHKDRNINLHLLDLATNKSILVSNRPGINSGAVFLPGDQEVALTLSFAGNPEIYRLNLKTKKLTPITHSAAIDVDPSLAGRADLMAFLSGRGGKANVYLADPRGVEKNVRRISYVGKFNATPRLAPDGQEIAFVSWADETFDIFRINSDGRGLVRLTKDFGSCEEPSYSPDGQFIVFQAKRLIPGATHPYNLYVMDREGDILGTVVQNLGNCTTPRWSK